MEMLLTAKTRRAQQKLDAHGEIVKVLPASRQGDTVRDFRGKPARFVEHTNKHLRWVLVNDDPEFQLTEFFVCKCCNKAHRTIDMGRFKNVCDVCEVVAE